MKRNNIPDKVLHAQEVFTDAFSRVLKEGKKDEFEDYNKALSILIQYVWENRNNLDSVYSIENLNKNCIRLLSECAKSSNYESKLLYLQLVDKIYMTLYNCLNKEIQDNKYIYEKPYAFNILSAYHFYKSILREIEISDFEKCTFFPRLLYHINYIETAAYAGYKELSEKKDIVIRQSIIVGTAEGIQLILPIYIREQKQKGSNPDIHYWSKENIIWSLIDNEKYVDENHKYLFENEITSCGIYYICGLILNGQFDIAKEVLKKSLSIYRHNYSWDKKIVMAVFVFLYYASWCEKEDYVDPDLYQMIKEFSLDITASLRHFLLNSESQTVLIGNLETEIIVSDNSSELKNDETEVGSYNHKSHELNHILETFDFRIRENGFNKSIMSRTIDDFCMFSVLFLYLHGKTNLDWMGDSLHPINEYLSYIKTCEKNQMDDYSKLNTKDRIKKFFYFINADTLKKTGKDSEERNKIDNDADKIFEILTNTIKSKFKKNCIEEAREKQAKYLRNYKKIETNKSQWVSDISNELKMKFGTCLEFDSIKDLYYNKVTLFNLTTYTDMINTKISNTYKGEIVSHLIDCYISELAQNGSIVLKDRKYDFSDDQTYINYIRDNKLELFLGSEYLLSNRDYRKSEAFREVTEKATWIKTIGSLYGMAIKKGSVIFYIRKINSSVRDATPKDVSYMYAKESGVYEIMNGINVPFDTDEFSDYIGKERKIIEISAEIAVKTYKKDIGIYFINKGSL